jgi:flagellar motor switch protein FliM
MADVLSQKEIDQLLAAISIGNDLPNHIDSFKIIVEEAMERLRRSLVADIKNVVREAVKEAIAENR